MPKENEQLITRKELTDDEAAYASGGCGQFTETIDQKSVIHFCGGSPNSDVFELCYIGRRGCADYLNNGDDLRTALNMCSVCLLYHRTVCD